MKVLVRNFDNEILSGKIIETTRVGISKAKDLKLRFYIKGNLFVSKK